MDLIDKIKGLLKGIGLINPIIDIHYDNQKNVVGHVADENFKGYTDKEAQELLWNALKKNLESSELIKVIAIFHETPKERIERLSGFNSKKIRHSKFWFHQTPELAKYWLFIDVAKIGEEFKSFFLIICEKNKVNKGLTFAYNKEVLEFMELEQDEIYEELFSNTFNNAEAEIKMDLMNRYEELTAQQLHGKANMYWYVYQEFYLTPISKNQMMFNEIEINMLNDGIKKLEDFEIKKDIQDAIKKSTAFNSLKQNIT